MRPTGIRRRSAAALLTLALVGGLSGCGDSQDGTPSSIGSPSGSRASLRSSPAIPPAGQGGVRVLYDDPWTVEEGQWWLGSADAYFDAGDIPTYRRILESVNAGSISITVPGADGRYRTRVELDDVEPGVEGWCEDVAEASMEVAAGSRVVTMGSFETFEDLPVQAPGWYRVRYCVEEQDRAAAEDAFVGEDLTTYTGRHLIQIWPAPRAPDRIVREGSQWARALSSGRWPGSDKTVAPG